MENELQMFDNLMEIAKTGKITVTSGQQRQRNIILNMSLCKWRRKKKDIFQDRCILWHVNNNSNNNKKTDDTAKGYESKKNPSNIVPSDPSPLLKWCHLSMDISTDQCELTC